MLMKEQTSYLTVLSSKTFFWNFTGPGQRASGIVKFSWKSDFSLQNLIKWLASLSVVFQLLTHFILIYM